jgi:hypothetical protein
VPTNVPTDVSDLFRYMCKQADRYGYAALQRLAEPCLVLVSHYLLLAACFRLPRVVRPVDTVK